MVRFEPSNLDRMQITFHVGRRPRHGTSRLVAASMTRLEPGVLRPGSIKMRGQLSSTYMQGYEYPLSPFTGDHPDIVMMNDNGKRVPTSSTFPPWYRNQTWYGRKGFPAAGGIPCDSQPPPPFVSQYLDLRMRRESGGEWEKVTIDPGYRGVVILNLQSYGGMSVLGERRLWGVIKRLVLIFSAVGVLAWCSGSRARHECTMPESRTTVGLCV